jgi:hypothetical protein
MARNLFILFSGISDMKIMKDSRPIFFVLKKQRKVFLSIIGVASLIIWYSELRKKNVVVKLNGHLESTVTCCKQNDKTPLTRYTFS